MTRGARRNTVYEAITRAVRGHRFQQNPSRERCSKALREYGPTPERCLEAWESGPGVWRHQGREARSHQGRAALRHQGSAEPSMLAWSKLRHHRGSKGPPLSTKCLSVNDVLRLETLKGDANKSGESERQMPTTLAAARGTLAAAHSQTRTHKARACQAQTTFSPGATTFNKIPHQ